MSRNMSYWLWSELREPLRNPYVKKNRTGDEGGEKKEKAPNCLKAILMNRCPVTEATLWSVELACFGGGSRKASEHAADFRVSEITRGETKMWCQLLKESYHRYWILSLVWVDIALHLLLTTSFSIHGSFTNSSGLLTPTEMKSTRLAGSVVVENKVISVLC